MFKKFIISLMFIISAFASLADTLLWQVNQNSAVHGANGTEYGSLYMFLSPQPWSPNGDENGNHYIYGARIKVCDAYGNVLRMMETENGNIILNSNNSPVDIGHPNSPNGLGATGISTDDNNIQADRNYYYQMSIVQGFHNKWNDDEHYIFNEIAWSAMYSGELLEANGSYVLSDDLSQLTAIWVPEEFYTYKPVPAYDFANTPEPSTSILMLMGVSILLLRRKCEKCLRNC